MAMTTMTTAIQQALRPLFITGFIIGLGVYPLKELKPGDGWIIYLSILYSVTIWFVYGYLFYYMVSSVSLRAIFRATISIVVMEINIITTITSVILSIYYEKRFRICMKKLAVVDDTLEELGTPKIYQEMHTWSKRVVIGWFVFSLATNFCDTKWWLHRKETNSWGFIIPHLYNHTCHVNTFVDLAFVISMWYIGSRFDKVNEHIQCLLVQEKCGLKDAWKKFVVGYRHTSYTLTITNILWSLMHLHLELCRIARELNLMFGTQMTFQMASYLLTLTSSCYYLYGMLMREDRAEIPIIAWCHVLLWAIVFLVKLCIINCICENISVKRFEISMKKLAVVDDTLEKLGTPKMYEKLHMRSKQIIICWIVYSLAMNFIDTIWWLSLEETASFGLYIAHVVNHGFHINAFMDMLFAFFLWYIGTRFDKVNEHMRCLLKKEDHELRCTWKRSMIAFHQYTLYTNYKLTLWTSMQLHLELCRLARELNLIFAVQMTFEMAFFLSYLTSLFYYLYWMLIQEHWEKIYSIYDWISIIFWVFVLLVRIYIVNYTCDNVTQKANKIGKLFHQLSHIHRYADIWKEIYQFTLQTMHHPLKFTGMGLFYFGHEFLRK
ncbi:PREDICTED: uncharacterized protein LOC105462193, partial [Wasmannia auropunctata]|uniref:uncharacterized protein LOC105462193 n=1 Tax=Wasmannia auropunctata TaxID=64793 RepID=UPI0005EEB1B2